MNRFPFLLAALLPTMAFAALPATAIINIQSTATAGNVNGGGFNSARGGTNYSLQNAAQLHLTNLTTTGAAATTITTITGGSFTSVMVGNYIHINSGTNFTAGWYEIVTFTDANNVILDRTPSPGGAGVIGDGYVGGAMSLGSTLDADIFATGIAGQIFYVKSGNYTIGETVTFNGGTVADQIKCIGYTSTQGDACTGTNRPVIDASAFTFTMSAGARLSNLYVKSTAAVAITAGASCVVENLKVLNYSTTAARTGLDTGNDVQVTNCEMVSYRGKAVHLAASMLRNCLIHSSDIGVATVGGATNGIIISNCIIASNFTSAISTEAAQTSRSLIEGNTIFGFSNKGGIGLNLINGATNAKFSFYGNILSGFTTAVSYSGTQTIASDDFNDYFNNTADLSGALNWQKGPNDAAVDPAFTSVAAVTGATATTTSGNHLVQSGATFLTGTIPVVAGRDYVYVASGTGVTAGYYGIASVDSDTQITTDIALTANATADKAFKITVGRNFAIGAAMKGLGGPIVFGGAYSTSYPDQGAVQRQETDGGGASVFIQ